MKIDIKGIDELAKKLEKASSVRFDGVSKKNTVEFFNRAKNKTPVDTTELKTSISVNLNEFEVGYMKDYAPHVEYGHRKVNGGFVEGQLFLKESLDAQGATYENDLSQELKKVM